MQRLEYASLISCVLTETLQNFSTFCHFSFEGGGGSKRKLRELSFLSDIDILTVGYLLFVNGVVC